MFCLNLVLNIWPSSVLPSSGSAKFDFCHVLPKSGLGKTDVLPKSVLPSSGAPLASQQQVLQNLRAIESRPSVLPLEGRS